MTVAAVLVAGGSGSRLGLAVPKAFCEVRGRTLLQHAVTRFAGHPLVRDVVVVVPRGYLDAVPGSVAGGVSRQKSVWLGLAAVAADVDAVLVHDVARPFVPDAVITRVVEALAGGADAVVPVLAVTDTIKRVNDADHVVETLDRSALRAVQTPQGFRRAVLIAAHALTLGDVTDDAGLVEAMGGTVMAVEGADESFKITRPWDLLVAEAVATLP